MDKELENDKEFQDLTKAIQDDLKNIGITDKKQLEDITEYVIEVIYRTSVFYTKDDEKDED